MYFRLCQQLQQLATHIVHWLDEERERRNQDEPDMKIVEIYGVVMDDIDMTDDMDDINMTDDMDDIDMAEDMAEDIDDIDMDDVDSN